MYLKLFYAIKVSILGTKNSVFPILPPHFAHWVGFKCCYPISGKHICLHLLLGYWVSFSYNRFSFHVFLLEGKCILPEINTKKHRKVKKDVNIGCYVSRVLPNMNLTDVKDFDWRCWFWNVKEFWHGCDSRDSWREIFCEKGKTLANPPLNVLPITVE